VANHIIDKEGLAKQLEIVANDILRATLAMQRLGIQEADEISHVMSHAIVGLMWAHALAFDAVPPWGPDEYTDKLPEMSRDKRRSTN
jgi:hypothetical protein